MKISHCLSIPEQHPWMIALSYVVGDGCQGRGISSSPQRQYRMLQRSSWLGTGLKREYGIEELLHLLEHDRLHRSQLSQGVLNSKLSHLFLVILQVIMRSINQLYNHVLSFLLHGPDIFTAVMTKRWTRERKWHQGTPSSPQREYKRSQWPLLSLK